MYRSTTKGDVVKRSDCVLVQLSIFLCTSVWEHYRLMYTVSPDMFRRVIAFLSVFSEHLVKRFYSNAAKLGAVVQNGSEGGYDNGSSNNSMDHQSDDS